MFRLGLQLNRSCKNHSLLSGCTICSSLLIFNWVDDYSKTPCHAVIVAHQNDRSFTLLVSGSSLVMLPVRLLKTSGSLILCGSSSDMPSILVHYHQSIVWWVLNLIDDITLVLKKTFPFGSCMWNTVCTQPSCKIVQPSKLQKLFVALMNTHSNKTSSNTQLLISFAN